MAYQPLQVILHQIHFNKNSSISNNSVRYEYTVYMSKTFLLQAIQFIQTELVQFSISTDFVYTVKCQKQFYIKQFSLA